MSDSFNSTPIGRYITAYEGYQTFRKRQVDYAGISIMAGLIVGILAYYFLSHGIIPSDFGLGGNITVAALSGSLVSTVAIAGILLNYSLKNKKKRDEIDATKFHKALIEMEKKDVTQELYDRLGLMLTDDNFTSTLFYLYKYTQTLKLAKTSFTDEEKLTNFSKLFNSLHGVPKGTIESAERALSVLLNVDLIKFINAFYLIKNQNQTGKDCDNILWILLQAKLKIALEKYSKEQWSTLLLKCNRLLSPENTTAFIKKLKSLSAIDNNKVTFAVLDLQNKLCPEVYNELLSSGVLQFS